MSSSGAKGLNLATRVCDVCPDKCRFAVLCRFRLQCGLTLRQRGLWERLKNSWRAINRALTPKLNVAVLVLDRAYSSEQCHKEEGEVRTNYWGTASVRGPGTTLCYIFPLLSRRPVYHYVSILQINRLPNLSADGRHSFRFNVKKNLVVPPLRGGGPLKKKASTGARTHSRRPCFRE